MSVRVSEKEFLALQERSSATPVRQSGVTLHHPYPADRKRQKSNLTQNMTPLEAHLMFSIRSHGLPEPISQFRPWSARRYRVDFCYPVHKIAIECEGGAFLAGGGAHQRIGRFTSDIEKYNLLALDGYLLLRFHAHHIKSGEAAETIKKALQLRESNAVNI